MKTCHKGFLVFLASVGSVVGGEVSPFADVYPSTVKTVGVVMPASVYAKDKFDAGVAAIKAAGYRVKLAPRLKFDSLAPAEDRAADLADIWTDPEVNLVLCARGGSGSEKVVPFIDWARLKTRPDQTFLGFSDITIFHNAMLREGIGHPVSGPTMSSIARSSMATRQWLRRALAGEPQPPVQLHALKPGAFSGFPVGGHAHRYSVALRLGQAGPISGKVVFLESEESISEKLLGDTFNYLLTSGCLDEAAGVIFGDLTPYTDAVKQMKSDFAARAKCPVYDGFPYGHGTEHYAVDHLRKVSVDAAGVMTWATTAQE